MNIHKYVILSLLFASFISCKTSKLLNRSGQQKDYQYKLLDAQSFSLASDGVLLKSLIGAFEPQAGDSRNLSQSRGLLGQYYGSEAEQYIAEKDAYAANLEERIKTMRLKEEAKNPQKDPGKKLSPQDLEKFIAAEEDRIRAETLAFETSDFRKMNRFSEFLSSKDAGKKTGLDRCAEILGDQDKLRKVEYWEQAKILRNLDEYKDYNKFLKKDIVELIDNIERIQFLSAADGDADKLNQLFELEKKGQEISRPELIVLKNKVDKVKGSTIEMKEKLGQLAYFSTSSLGLAKSKVANEIRKAALKVYPWFKGIIEKGFKATISVSLKPELDKLVKANPNVKPVMDGVLLYFDKYFVSEESKFETLKGIIDSLLPASDSKIADLGKITDPITKQVIPKNDPRYKELLEAKLSKIKAQGFMGIIENVGPAMQKMMQTLAVKFDPKMKQHLKKVQDDLPPIQPHEVTKQLNDLFGKTGDKAVVPELIDDLDDLLSAADKNKLDLPLEKIDRDLKLAFLDEIRQSFDQKIADAQTEAKKTIHQKAKDSTLAEVKAALAKVDSKGVFEDKQVRKKFFEASQDLQRFKGLTGFNLLWGDGFPMRRRLGTASIGDSYTVWQKTPDGGAKELVLKLKKTGLKEKLEREVDAIDAIKSELSPKDAAVVENQFKLFTYTAQEELMYSQERKLMKTVKEVEDGRINYYDQTIDLTKSKRQADAEALGVTKLQISLVDPPRDINISEDYHDSVIVMEKADGESLKALLENAEESLNKLKQDPKKNRDQIEAKLKEISKYRFVMEETYRSWINSAIVNGNFHGDPHGGNMFVDFKNDGTAKVTFIDLGGSDILKTEARKDIAKLLGSFKLEEKGFRGSVGKALSKITNLNYNPNAEARNNGNFSEQTKAFMEFTWLKDKDGKLLDNGLNPNTAKDQAEIERLKTEGYTEVTEKFDLLSNMVASANLDDKCNIDNPTGSFLRSIEILSANVKEFYSLEQQSYKQVSEIRELGGVFLSTIHPYYKKGLSLKNLKTDDVFKKGPAVEAIKSINTEMVVREKISAAKNIAKTFSPFAVIAAVATAGAAAALAESSGSCHRYYNNNELCENFQNLNEKATNILKERCEKLEGNWYDDLKCGDRLLTYRNHCTIKISPYNKAFMKVFHNISDPGFCPDLIKALPSK